MLEQLREDQKAVDQVREIVEAEEAVMKRETEAVQNYADVSNTLDVVISFHELGYEVILHIIMYFDIVS